MLRETWHATERELCKHLSGSLDDDWDWQIHIMCVDKAHCHSGVASKSSMHCIVRQNLHRSAHSHQERTRPTFTNPGRTHVMNSLAGKIQARLNILTCGLGGGGGGGGGGGHLAVNAV